MRRHVAVSVVLVVVLAGATTAAAQVLQLPPRSTRGLFGAPRHADPNRAAHELALTFNLLGGYEDNLTPGGEGVTTDPLAPRQSGSTGLFAGDVQYSYGTQTRFIGVNGRGYMNSFRNLDLRPMYGGEVNVNGATQLGDKAGITASAGGRYQPTFTLGAVGLGSPEVQSGAVAPTDPTIGVSEMRSVGGDTSSTLTYNWSLRHRTNAGYGYSRQRVTSLTEVNSTSHVASLGHGWDVRRALGLLFSYQYSSHSSEIGAGVTRPVDSQQGQLGVEYRKSVSPTRRIVFTGGAGAMHVKTLASSDNRPFEYVAPSGFGGARIDLGRTWAVSVDLRRDVTVLEGLTQQSFLTDVAALWIGGNIGQSWIVAVNGSFSEGRPHEGEIGSYESMNGTAQVQYALTRCCTVLGSYSYYAHRLRDLSSIPAGFPNRFDRSAVSVGFTIWLPLYGAFPAGRPAPAGRN
ncbi:MAG: hypothetical protein ACRD26_16810 [Vicinamibacterales bacterium]